MASPIGHPANQGNGIDQLKAQVLGWIREELGRAAQGGIGLHLDGATGNLIIDAGQVQSGNYAAGSTGWALKPTGDGEFDGVSIAAIAATVADLSSRVTRTATIATFNTGSLPNDGAFHAYGPSIPITIDVPTGKLVVTVGCGQATLNAGSASVEADATFSISSGVASLLDYSSSVYLGTNSVVPMIGAPLNMQRAFTVTPGTYTVTGQMVAWATGTTTASVNFQQPFLTVQVTG